MDKSCLVTVIIPVYNSENYIKECLMSLFSQTYKNIEIIVVDDKGTDNSMKIVKNMKKLSTFEIRIIEQEKNKGVSEARNIGMNQAKGEYIFFLDSDDLITSDCIEVLIKEIIKFKADLVMGDYKRFYREDFAEVLNNAVNNKNNKNIICKEISYNEPNGYVCNVLYKKDFILENNIYFEKDIKFAEDALWITLVQFRAKKMIRINAKTYLYRITLDSSCIELCAKDKYLDNLILVIEKFFEYIKSENYSNLEKGVLISRIRTFKNEMYSSIDLYNKKKEDINYKVLKKVRVSVKEVYESGINSKQKLTELIFSLIPILDGYYFYKIIFKVRNYIKKV